jgi:hypothetical protein
MLHLVPLLQVRFPLHALPYCSKGLVAVFWGEFHIIYFQILNAAMIVPYLTHSSCRSSWETVAYSIPAY